MFEYYLIIPIFLNGEIKKEYEIIHMLEIPKQINGYITRTYTKRKYINNNNNKNIHTHTHKKNSRSRNKSGNKYGSYTRKNNTVSIPQQKLLFDSFE